MQCQYYEYKSTVYILYVYTAASMYSSIYTACICVQQYLYRKELCTVVVVNTTTTTTPVPYFDIHFSCIAVLTQSITFDRAIRTIIISGFVFIV